MRTHPLVLFCLLSACGFERGDAPDAASIDARASDAPDPDATPGPAALTILGGPLVVADVVLAEPAVLMVTIENEGNTDATGIAISDDSAEVTTIDDCGSILEAHATCQVTLTLTATSIGAKLVMLQVTADGGVSDSAAVSATARARVTVTMNLVGTTARIQSAPSMIDCTSGTCTGLFDTSPVVLTATSLDSNGTLADWGVGGCSTSDPCTLTVTNANQALTAEFRAPWNYLATDASGNQFNSVVTDPSDGSVVAVGSLSNGGRAIRLSGLTGAFLDDGVAAPVGAGPKYYADVTIRNNGTFWASGSDNTGAIADALSTQLTPSSADTSGSGTGGGITTSGSDLLWIGTRDPTNTFIHRSGPSPISDASVAGTFHGNDVAISPLDASTWAVAGVSPNARVISFALGASMTASVTSSSDYTGRGFTGLVLDAAGNLLIVGTTTTPDDDIKVWKLSPTFVEAWGHPLVVTGADQGMGIALDPDGNIVAVGNSSTLGCVIVKLRAANGNVILQRNIAGTSCTAVASDAQGIVVVGFQESGIRQSFARRYFH